MKRIISLLVILIMLILPFSILLNVKAVALNTDQNNKVLNVSSDGVVVNGVGENDTFALYKILDVYYNSRTNEISYDFTNNFRGFANSLDPPISVNEYLTSSTETENVYYDNNTILAENEFNRLVSRYAKYIRENNIVYDEAMTTTTNSSTGQHYAYKTDVVAGAYLIFPTSFMSENGIVNNLFPALLTYNYGVMIANVTPTVSNNDWTFEKVEINAKSDASSSIAFLLEDVNFANGTYSNLGASLNYKTDKVYSYFANYGLADKPINAYGLNYTALRMIDIEYPSTMMPDFTDLYTMDNNLIIHYAKIENNKFYVINNQEEVAIADVTYSNNKLTLEYYDHQYQTIIHDLIIDSNNLNTNVEGNKITSTTYAVKDAYVEVGMDVTRDDIRNAFIEDDPNYNSTKSVNIRRAIVKVEQSVNLYVSGININNRDKDNNSLSGGEFAIYSTYDNGVYSNQLGDNIVINDGIGVFNGLDPTETYFLKQEKASNGYKLYTDKVIVLKGTSDTNTYDSSTYQVIEINNNVYDVTIINSANALLPFTGGHGSIIYTGIGLIIVVGSALFIVLFKKKKKETIEEL